MRRRLPAGMSGVFFFLASCTSLQHIHQFALSSDAAVRLYSEISFTASLYCAKTYCIDPQTYITGSITKTPRCNCDDFKNADRSIVLINSVLHDYLAALEALSNGSSASLSFNALESSVRALPETSRLGLTTADIGAAKRLAQNLTDAITASARRHQLTRVVFAADSALQQVIAAQQQNMVWLENITKQQSAEDAAAFSSLTARAASAGEKYLLAIELERRESGLADQRILIEKFRGALGKIAQAHHTLNKNRNTLKDAAFRKKLFEAAAELRQTVLDFNELHN